MNSVCIKTGYYIVTLIVMAWFRWLPKKCRAEIRNAKISKDIFLSVYISDVALLRA
jgi:hypothetical protein